MHMPKRLRGPSPAHNHAPVQEAKAAARIGGAVTRGSGNGYVKGDARRPGLVRVECKSTSAKSFSVTRDTMEKIEAAAFGADEVPVLQVELLGPSAPGLCDMVVQKRVYVVPDWALEDLFDRLVTQHEKIVGKSS